MTLKRALDGVRRRVMVDDRRRPSLERLERTEHRRPPDHLEIKGTVEPPPHELEDLLEVVGVPAVGPACRGQEPNKVMVAADEPWA